MFLEKLNNFFSRRSLALCLCFLISFSFFNFNKVEEVKANPIVAPVVEELAPIIISILGSMGIVVSIPVASDFVEWTKEHSANADLPTWNHEGLMSYAPQAIQCVKSGYYASKNFVQGLLEEWEQYRISKGVESQIVGNVTTYTFPSFIEYNGFGSHTQKQFFDYYLDILKNVDVTIPFGCYEFTLVAKSSSGDSTSYLNPSNSKALFESLPQHLSFSVDVWNKQFGYKDFFINHTTLLSLNTGVKGFVFDFGSYQSKPKVNQKVIDNTLNPVNAQSQGMLITPEQTEAIGKVLDPSIPDVPNSSISSTAPITSVASDVPNFVDGSKVGAVDWGANGIIDKPTDGTIDKPTDGTNSIGGFLGAILDILKKILDWIENFFKALLEFLKYILVPSDGYFVDTFNHFRTDLEGKFGFDTSPLKDLSSNSSVVTPQFIYNFTVLGVPVTLDFSFIVKVVPYCHIIFGGLTAIFLCWYNLKNILLIIRGTSYIEGSNSTGQSEKRG